MKFIKKIKKLFKNPRILLLFIVSNKHVSSLFSDKAYLKIMYSLTMKKKLNLKSPKTMNEKLQWLKLYNRKPIYTIMADKYKARDYVAEKLGEEYLIPLLGVWDDPDDIDFDKLPDKFVLKCNHNSGLGMCICKDKSKLDIEKVKRELKKGLKQDYYKINREWPYKDIPRKIICEKYMEDNEYGEIKDYKIHNFNGTPKFILVCDGRFSKEGLTEDFYDTNWNRLNIKRPAIPNKKVPHPKPELLDEMLRISTILAKDIPFARTDFYVINGKIYFGEITFFPASGMSKYEPEKWDDEFGSWIDLKN